MSVTPATIARQAARKRAEARNRYEASRRRDARAHGYHGPLTRDELAEITRRAYHHPNTHHPREVTAMQSLKSRIREDNIRASADYRPEGAPDYTDGMSDMNWWNVTLRIGRRRMTVPFGMGYAHTGEPSAYDVLSCLLSDASSADQDFEDWAADYSYDTDSRRAEKTYNAVVRQTEQLRNFLGDKFSDYVWETEH